MCVKISKIVFQLFSREWFPTKFRFCHNKNIHKLFNLLIEIWIKLVTFTSCTASKLRIPKCECFSIAFVEIKFGRRELICIQRIAYEKWIADIRYKVFL